jgi:hypothetical protein
MFHKMSDLTRTVFRKGVGGTLDKVVVAQISGVLYARLGSVAERIAYDEFMLALPKTKVASARQRAKLRAEQRRGHKAGVKAAKVADQVDESLETLIADAQQKARQKALTLDEVKRLGDKGQPTNNYHQTRLGILLGCIEMIALGEKAAHFENTEEWWLGAGASLASVGSIVMDTYYSAAKSVREIAPYKDINAIKNGADVVRGGFKLGAGVLGAGAGFVGAYLDWGRISKESNVLLKSIYGIRAVAGGVSGGLTLVAAFSYAEPYLEYRATNYAKRRLAINALKVGAEWAGKQALRVRILVWVARLNLAGLVLTAGEIGYLWFKDDDLQNWCEQSVFRKEKVLRIGRAGRVINEHFKNVDDELKALNEASHVIGAP